MVVGAAQWFKPGEPLAIAQASRFSGWFEIWIPSTFSVAPTRALDNAMEPTS